MATDPVADAFFEVEEVDPPERVTRVGGASRIFRHYDQHQSFLLPPSLDDWLPNDHTARFISEAVDEMLDLTPVYASCERADGAPPYDPKPTTVNGTSPSLSRLVPTECHRRCRTSGVGHRHLAGPF